MGRAAMLPTSRCLYCIAHRDLNSVDDPPKDSIAHVLRCPRHKRLVDWTTDMCTSIGAPGVQFSGLLLFGHGGSSKQQTDAVEAIRGAAAAALRLARNRMLKTHDAELPGNSMVNTAKRELRRHIDADWIHARGMVEQHPDERRSRHRIKRPLTVAAFLQKWPDTVLTRRGDKIYYRSSLLPKGHTGDGGSGVNAGVDGDGENGKDGDSGSGAGGANGLPTSPCSCWR